MQKETKIQKKRSTHTNQKEMPFKKKRNGTEQCNLITIHRQPDHILISVPCLKSE